MSNIAELNQFSHDLPNVVDKQLFNHSEDHRVYDSILAETAPNELDSPFMGLLSLTQVRQLNLFESNDFEMLWMI